MKLLFLGNMNDIHTPKWAEYFKTRHEVKLFHADSFSLSALWNLKKQIADFGPDILHAHYSGAWGLMGALSGFHPFVVTIHGSEVLLTEGIKKKLVKYVLRKADVITTDGMHIVTKLKTEWGIEDVKLIQFGVDCEIFKPDPLLKSETPFIVCRGGNSSIYDTETFKKAMGEIVQNKVKQGVEFQILEGIPSADMPNILNKAWIYVSCAKSDAGLSMTTAEAMACGLPVIVSDFGDNVKWAGRGWCFKPGNYEILANRIVFLINDKKQRELFGKRNRDKILGNDNYTVEMAKMENIYKEACNG